MVVPFDETRPSRFTFVDAPMDRPPRDVESAEKERDEEGTKTYDATLIDAKGGNKRRLYYAFTYPSIERGGF